MKTVTFHFDQDLAELLPRSWPFSTGRYRFAGPQSAKHLIKALGIPHTEVGAIVANGSVLGLDYLVRDGDLIEVLGSPRVMGLDVPCFLIDGHLGRLNAGLRMLGFDCAHVFDYSDTELVDPASSHGRILPTRDRRLLMRKSVVRSHLVRSLNSLTQLRDVIHRF